MAHYSWWNEERAQLNIDRGPWLSSSDVFRAAGERELEWTKRFAKPRLPYERLYQEIYKFKKATRDTQIKNLAGYLTLSPYLGFGPTSPLNRPVLRHPDFQPNNILQHSTILPLAIAAGIPKHFQNHGDPESEALRQPQTKLSPDYESLTPSEQLSAREAIRKRIIHFLYAALTKRANVEHYDAIYNQSAILQQQLLKSAGSPWEGNSITLRAYLIRAMQNWSTLITPESAKQERPDRPPIEYSEMEVNETCKLDSEQKEAGDAFEQMRDILGVDEQGWVLNDEYETAKEMACEIKARMLEGAETPNDLIAVRDHFPFDDFDEGS